MRVIGRLGVVLVLLATLLVLRPTIPTGEAVEPEAELSSPLLAYYYIWFDRGSWRRAKTDYPLLGRYSSDDEAVMRQHIRWAQQVGIDGFIVSWKSTDTLNARLKQLAAIAAAEQFKLVIIYQGLNFEREPLPADRVAMDLDIFTTSYARHPAFDLFERPVVIWSGTWKFSREEVARVAQGRDEILLLASEKNIAGYERIADLVDGNAYYWSSVNPDTYPGYPGKLVEMGQAAHARDGLWIAPAAPGFDARLIGGSRVIPRDAGAMLRRQINGAVQSNPDAVGLISWNEFSENSHIEPSEQHGMEALNVVAEIQGRTPPDLPPPATPQPRATALTYGLPLVAVGALLILLSLIAIARHRHPRADQAGTSP